MHAPNISPAARFIALVLVFILSPFWLTAIAAPGDEHWDTQFGVPGVTNDIFAVAVNGGVVYAAGGTPAGTLTNAPLYAWDGKQWSVIAIFSGPSFMRINALAFVGNTLYAAGNFTNVNGVAANGLARWDGTGWSGTGFTGTAYALAVDGNNLYVGGAYTNAGGVAATNIGYWDGSAWHALGDGLGLAGGNDSVRAIAIHNGSVYAGGIFTNSGSSSITNLAVWDGSTWTQVGGGLSSSGAVLALAFNGGDLYVGGAFSQVGATAANGVAEWDGANWSNLDGGLNAGGIAESLAFLNGTVCVVGSFTGAGGITATNFAIWNGSSWSTAGNGLSGAGMCAVSTGTNVYIGGLFEVADTVLAYYIASWDGTQWSPLGSPGRLNGLSSFALALAYDGTNLYAGGGFGYAGQTKVGSIARFDGTNWHAVGGNGVNFGIGSLALFGTNIIVGSQLSPYIFGWNGTRWFVPTNDPIAGSVSAMTVSSNSLYLVGSFWFFDVSNHPAFYCARWDGTNWWSVTPADNFSLTGPPPPTGVGMDAVAVKGSDVFFGGNFIARDMDTFPASVYATNIVRWDGSRWQLMGTGVNSNVLAMAVLGTNLYVGGLFTNASGITANKIAMWNGNSWSDVGGGVVGNGNVFALTTMGNDLYAGGSFTNMGGVPANLVARWDGTNWYALGSGLGGRSASVQSLCVAGPNVFVGGNFRVAGNKRANDIARWNEQINFDIPQLINPRWLAARQFQARLYGISGLTNIIQASTNLTSWVPILTNSDGIYDFTDPSASGYPYRFYRAVLGP